MFVKCLQIEVYTVGELVYKWIRSIIGKVKWLNVSKVLSLKRPHYREYFSFCSACFIKVYRRDEWYWYRK